MSNTPIDSLGILSSTGSTVGTMKTLTRSEMYPLPCRNTRHDERIIINVRGTRFETYRATLETYPETLLGSISERTKYYDPIHKEIRFDRDKDIFNYILFFYQSQGILSKPPWVTEQEFVKEIRFFAIDVSYYSSQISKARSAMKDPKQNLPTGKLRQKIWKLVERPDSSPKAKLLAQINIGIIVLSLFTYCLETLPEVRTKEYIMFFIIETVFVIWFTLEYLVRLICAASSWNFFKSPIGIIDLLVILPYFITVALNAPSADGVTSLSFLRLIRLIRVLRLLKLSRYSKGLRVLGKTISESHGQLRALFLCLAMAIILSSSALYYFEGFGNPTSKFQSIPDSFWFVIVTMTTVGYGDLVPFTILGKISSAFTLLAGIIILLCLPTPVFITHFSHFYKLLSLTASEGETDENNGENLSAERKASTLLIPAWLKERGKTVPVRYPSTFDLRDIGMNVHENRQRSNTETNLLQLPPAQRYQSLKSSTEMSKESQLQTVELQPALGRSETKVRFTELPSLMAATYGKTINSAQSEGEIRPYASEDQRIVLPQSLVVPNFEESPLSCADPIQSPQEITQDEILCHDEIPCPFDSSRIVKTEYSLPFGNAKVFEGSQTDYVSPDSKIIPDPACTVNLSQCTLHDKNRNSTDLRHSQQYCHVNTCPNSQNDSEIIFYKPNLHNSIVHPQSFLCQRKGCYFDIDKQISIKVISESMSELDEAYSDSTDNGIVNLDMIKLLNQCTQKFLHRSNRGRCLSDSDKLSYHTDSDSMENSQEHSKLFHLPQLNLVGCRESSLKRDKIRDNAYDSDIEQSHLLQKTAI